VISARRDLSAEANFTARSPFYDIFHGGAVRERAILPLDRRECRQLDATRFADCRVYYGVYTQRGGGSGESSDRLADADSRPRAAEGEITYSSVKVALSAESWRTRSARLRVIPDLDGQS